MRRSDVSRVNLDVTDRARVFLTITLFAVAAFVAVGLGSASPFDWPFDAGAPIFHVANHTGPFGSALAFLVVRLFGSLLAWAVPALLAGVAVALARDAAAPVRRVALKGFVGVVLLNAFFAVSPVTSQVASLRGWLGNEVAAGLSAVFGEVGSAIVLVATVLLLALGEAHVLRWAGTAARGLAARSRAGIAAAREGLARRRAVMTDYVRSAVERSAHDDGGEEAALDADEDAVPPRAATAADGWEEPALAAKKRRREPDIAIAAPPARAESKPRAKKRAPEGDGAAPTTPITDASLPPLSILEQPGEAGATFTRDDLRNWSGVLEEKLNQFGVQGKVTAVHHGPVVTTFEFEPAPGVRIKDIVSRSDDLALAMRARSIRLIAPIPGRAVVGIEMPNPRARTVYLYEVLSEVTETQRLKGVMMGLGVDVVGKPFLMNLCEAPHLLIAGTTGSGKSVCLNALLASILLHYRPSDVQLLLVDPKMVEMSQYNGIPHLLHPVITDPKEAARVLEFLVAEMGRRNELFRRHGVRNLESYNAKVALQKSDDPAVERLPYIVLVVDELGDLALAKGVDIESLLTRLAQMARAAGIHMVLATQRPS
ncbi:MAG TPA: DNA translocase FtsK 4TM domain-containing protein, partial [Candidatus Krumholzibacteria bacterium]|nr:DNA translocase FtsK 4TM domain-containing protein [Candidatus Krumholzibacteria bacterium]